MNTLCLNFVAETPTPFLTSLFLTWVLRKSVINALCLLKSRCITCEQIHKTNIDIHVFYSDLSISHDLHHSIQSKRYRLRFSTKTCSCYSTKTHINSVILILKLNLTSLRKIYIKMCEVLNEDHFLCCNSVTLFLSHNS